MNLPVPNLVRTLQTQLSLNATTEALMEVQRAWLKQENILTLQRWLGDWTERDERHKKLLRENEPCGAVDSMDASLFAEWEQSLSALNESLAQFSQAFEERNRPLVDRWIEEWKARREKFDRFAKDWLNERVQINVAPENDRFARES